MLPSGSGHSVVVSYRGQSLTPSNEALSSAPPPYHSYTDPNWLLEEYRLIFGVYESSTWKGSPWPHFQDNTVKWDEKMEIVLPSVSTILIAPSLSVPVVKNGLAGTCSFLGLMWQFLSPVMVKMWLQNSGHQTGWLRSESTLLTSLAQSYSLTNHIMCGSLWKYVDYFFYCFPYLLPLSIIGTEYKGDRHGGQWPFQHGQVSLVPLFICGTRL